MSNDFQGVVKHLDLNRASKDTIQNVKPLTLNESRAIKKVQNSLVLSVKTYNPVFLNNLPRLIFQYDLSIGYNFSLSLPNLGGYVRGGDLFVKWRVGTTVYRYRLALRSNNVDFRQSLLRQFFNDYTGELIPSNCVFEFWVTSTTSLVVGVALPLHLKLSPLRNPVTADDTGSDIASGNPLEIADLGVALPEVLPYNQPNIAWLNN
jgi:hypothetical protein